MSVRRRSDDDDWEAAKQRAPWGGPTSQWGEDVNTRLGNLEMGHEELRGTVDKIASDTGQLVALFKGTKMIGSIVIGVGVVTSALVTAIKFLVDHFKP